MIALGCLDRICEVDMADDIFIRVSLPSVQDDETGTNVVFSVYTTTSGDCLDTLG